MVIVMHRDLWRRSQRNATGRVTTTREGDGMDDDAGASYSESGWPEFRWLERGEGEPVVLLHGLMGRMDHWEETLEVLGDGCRAIALSLPILEVDLPETSIEGIGRHVVRFLDAVDIPRAVIGGNSLGGHVALEIALSHPERVSGLVLTGSSGLFERSSTRGVPHRPTEAYVRQKMEEVVFDPRLVTPEWVESIRRVVTSTPSALRVLRFARAAKRHNIEDRLPEITVPTLLVWGEQDRITPPEVGQRFHALLPDSRLAFLPRCGHAPMLERAEAFSAAVAAWLLDTQDRRGALVAGGVR
jgi:2-hydroxy-6-oxonona-2,4-dienedioate hydrolase